LRTSSAIVAAFAVFVFGTTDAFAAPGDAAPDEHEAALKTGLDQYARGDYLSAIGVWEGLLTTLGPERAYKVLYNLGLAYQQVGDVTHAIERYASFVEQVGARSDATTDLRARADDARARQRRLEAAHGALRVRAPAKGGLVLTRVGASAPRPAGYVLWLAPGVHDVELFVGTSEAKTIKVEVVAGKSIDVDTTMADPSVQVSTTEPTRAPLPAERSSRWTLPLGAAAVVSVALPVTLLFVASAKKDDAVALGTRHPDYAEAKSSYDDFRTAYYVSYALPAALAIAAVATMVWAPKRSGSRGWSTAISF
jgi:tetratricopeptide (TPR) repeat protein